jgi:hypothetical protein
MTEEAMAPSPTNGARRPLGAVVIAGVVALVVGLVAGLALGYFVEKSRVESDVDRLEDRLDDLRQRRQGGDDRLAGRVTAVAPGSLTMTSLDGSTITVSTESATIEGTTAGTPDDLTQDARVLVHVRDTARYGGFDVHEVLVLPADSSFGGSVTRIEGSEVTFDRRGGGSDTIDASANTNIFRTTPAPEVEEGATIFVSGRRSGDRIDAEEVLVLPPGTKLESNAGTS